MGGINIPGAVVDSPLLEMFQTREDTAPGDMGKGVAFTLLGWT